MRTRLGAAAWLLVESGWLAALVVGVLYFNPWSRRIFEPERVLLLCAIAALVGVGLIVGGVETERAAAVNAGGNWRRRVILAALALTAAGALATAWSIDPRLSFWGSGERLHGTYTSLSWLILLVAMTLGIRQAAQVERVVTTAIVTSVAAAAYAVLQRVGADPISWAAAVSRRATSTAGNPAFLAAVLMMVVPLTLARLMDQVARLRGAGHRPWSASGLAAGAYLIALTLQLAAIAFAQSRGPLLGLAVALLVFGALGWRPQQRWMPAAAVMLLLVAGLGLSTRPFAGQYPADRARLPPAADRLDASAAVRLLVWRGAAELLAADPARALVGYGPETFRLTFVPFAPPALAHAVPADRVIDRAHNETLDTLATTGAIGLTAQLTLFGVVCACGLASLGRLRDRTDRRRIGASVAVGALLGAALPYALGDGGRLAGVGLPLGMVAGLLVAVHAGQRRVGAADAEQPRAARLLVAALLAAVVGHFVEIQVGVASITTRLLFGAYAALLAAHPQRVTPDDAAPAPSADALLLNVVVGLVLLTLGFDFAPSPALAAHRVAWFSLLGGTWLFAGVLICADPRAGADQLAAWRARLRRYGLATVVPLLIAAGLALGDRRRPPAETHGEIPLAGPYAADVVAGFYLMVLLSISLAPAWAWWRGRADPPREPTPRWRIALAAGLTAAGLAIAATNLRVSRADVVSRLAELQEQQGHMAEAVGLAREALRLQPASEQYATALAQVLLARAAAQPAGTAASDRDASDALAILERTASDHPLNTEHLRNLARLHRRWAAHDAGRRAQHLADAQRAYAAAVVQRPRDAALLNERALLYAEQGELAAALALLDRSLELDDANGDSYLIRANLRFESGSLEAAVADYERSLAIDPAAATALAAQSGRALALAHLGRLDEAIDANQQVLASKPGDVIAHRNLAILYERTGRPDAARTAARAALARAAPDERAELERFIAGLDRSE